MHSRLDPFGSLFKLHAEFEVRLAFSSLSGEEHTTRTWQQGLSTLRNQYNFWREKRYASPSGRRLFWRESQGSLRNRPSNLLGSACSSSLIQCWCTSTIQSITSPGVFVIVIVLLFFCYAYAATNHKIKYQAFASSSPLNP